MSKPSSQMKTWDLPEDGGAVIVVKGKAFHIRKVKRIDHPVFRAALGITGTHHVLDDYEAEPITALYLVKLVYHYQLNDEWLKKIEPFVHAPRQK